MTLVTLQKPIAWPGNIGNIGNSMFENGSGTLDAAGEYMAVVLQAMENMTISHVTWRTSNVSGSPTADVRIETVAADGLPSGTLWATNTNIVTGTLSNGMTTSALTASASISRGQVFCVKIAYNSGTSFQFVVVTNRADISQNNVPYTVLNTGTPTKGVLSGTPAMALGSSSTVFYNVHGIIPISASAGSAFNNTSSARRGMRFTIPFNTRCVGLRFWLANAAGDYNAILMSDAGSELSSSSTAMDGDQSANSSAGSATVFFDSAVDLTAGTTYRAVIEPTSSTNTQVSAFTVPSSNYISTMPGGASAHYTTYVASSWTDSATTTFPLLDILLDQIDDGAGGGGGSGASFSAYAM